MQPPPSDSELVLLKILWRDGPRSAREVQDSLAGELDWTPSTTRTVLERMRAKGSITRKSVHGVAVYSPAEDKATVLGGVLRRVMRQVLEVDGPLPASAFAGSQILNAEELARLETLLNQDEGEN